MPHRIRSFEHLAGLSKLNSVSRLESRRRGRRCSRRVGWSGRPAGHRQSRGISRATIQQSRRLPE